MCETETSLTALQYLQSEVSSVVNHHSEKESAAFQKLLTFLLSRPMSPIAPSRPQSLPHPTDHHKAVEDAADVDMSEDAATAADSKAFPLSGAMARASLGGEADGTRSDELYNQRLKCFDSILEFVDPKAKQPKTDLVDLVKLQLL